MTRARHDPAYLASRMADEAAQLRALAATRRRAICDALIDLLNDIDGDLEAEPEFDTSADDDGEPCGATWQLAPLRFSNLQLGA